MVRHSSTHSEQSGRRNQFHSHFSSTLLAATLFFSSNAPPWHNPILLLERPVGLQTPDANLKAGSMSSLSQQEGLQTRSADAALSFCPFKALPPSSFLKAPDGRDKGSTQERGGRGTGLMPEDGTVQGIKLTLDFQFALGTEIYIVSEGNKQSPQCCT